MQEDGKSIAYGESFQEVARRCYDLNPQQILAVGVNCLAPRLVESLVSGINKKREHKPVPLIVYPNSGETYSVDLGYFNSPCFVLLTIIIFFIDGLIEKNVNLWIRMSNNG